MIRPVHQQRQRSTSKPQANKHSPTKRPNITTEHLAKKQQRAKETSKFKIQETSGLSISKPCAQNEGRHLDKDANKQRTPQEQTKQETTRPGETSKFKNKETSVLSPKKHNTNQQHQIKTQTKTEPQITIAHTWS